SLALAEREYYPDFEVSAAYDTIMGNGPARDLAPQAGVRLNVPIRRARREGAVAEAAAKVAARRAELARLTDQVNFQVQEARALDPAPALLLPRFCGAPLFGEGFHQGRRVEFAGDFGRAELRLGRVAFHARDCLDRLAERLDAAAAGVVKARHGQRLHLALRD